MRVSLFEGRSGASRAGIIIAAVLGAAAPAVADEAKVEAKLSAFAVSVDDAGQEVLQPTEQIDPGEVIEYKMDYKNVSDEELDGLVISGDVPDATAFLSAGALADYPAVFEVKVDGIGWSMEPVSRIVEDENGVLTSEEVPPEEYEAVRWRLSEELAPGDNVSVTYRIQVDS